MMKTIWIDFPDSASLRVAIHIRRKGGASSRKAQCDYYVFDDAEKLLVTRLVNRYPLKFGNHVASADRLDDHTCIYVSVPDDLIEIIKALSGLVDREVSFSHRDAVRISSEKTLSGVKSALMAQVLLSNGESGIPPEWQSWADMRGEPW